MTKFHNTLKSIPNLKVNSVAEALNWSWLVDFGQGDFAEAKAIAELVLLNDWNPDTLMVRAIVHQLQGEYNQALSLFTEAFSLASSTEQKLLIGTFAYLTEYKAQETLADTFAVSLNPNFPSLWLNRLKNQKKQLSNTNLTLKTNFVEQITKILPYFRTVLVRQSNLVQKERYSQRIQTKLTQQLEIYQSAEIYAIAEYLYGMLAQLLTLAGQIKPAWELLDHLTTAYSRSEQFLEAAWFALNQGDLIVTLNSWGNPILFGYSVAEVITNPLTPRNLDRSKINTATAQQLYAQAREYFNQAQAPRGEAMAIMRLAYLNAVGGQWNLAAFGYQEAQQYFTQKGDRLNAMAAAMGHLWSILQYQPLNSNYSAIIQEWTQWVQEQGAISWGMSWSFAFALAAEEALLVNQETAVALRLIEIAETIALKLETIMHNCFSVSYKQLWQSYLLILKNILRQIAEQLAIQNAWEQAFYLAQKIIIYEIQPSENNDYLIDILQATYQLQELTKHLKSGVLLLTYLVTEQALLIWAITQQGLVKTQIWQKVENQNFQSSLLADNIYQWLKQLSEYRWTKYDPKLLEKILLSPFINEINQTAHIIFMPCKQLQTIPFSALKFSLLINDNPLKKYYLGLKKSISYINSIQELVPRNKLLTKEKIIILTENGEFVDNQSTQIKAKTFLHLSITKSLILAIIDVFNSKLNIRKTTKVIHTVHLFLSSINLLLAKSMFRDLAAELAIVNIKDIPLNQFPRIELASLVQGILNAGAKTVVIIFHGEFSLATAMLTFLFHQRLSNGYSVAQSLYQAQKRISSLKAQEAINFCRFLQSYISWQTNGDRAIRGLLTKYMGDILVLGGDYIQATQAYEAAINIFYATGYVAEARTLQGNYQLFQSFEDISQPFSGDRLIFQTPTNWYNGFIFGDFSLKITK